MIRNRNLLDNLNDIMPMLADSSISEVGLLSEFPVHLNEGYVSWLYDTNFSSKRKKVIVFSNFVIAKLRGILWFFKWIFFEKRFIHTEVNAKSISFGYHVHYKFRDSSINYNQFDDSLSTDLYIVHYIPKMRLFDLKKASRELRKHQISNVYFFDDFIAIKDIFFILLKWLFLKLNKIGNDKILCSRSDLVFNQRLDDKFGKVALRNLLWESAVANISEKIKNNNVTTNVNYLFEGQGWEYILLRQFTKNLPNLSIGLILHAPMLPFELGRLKYFYTDKYRKIFRNLEFVSTSFENDLMLFYSFLPSVKCYRSQLFRGQRYIFSEVNYKIKRDRWKSIIIFGSINSRFCYEFLNALSEDERSRRFSLTYKNHPAVPLKFYNKLNRFEIYSSTKNIDDFDCAVTIGASSSIFELYYKGIPNVHIFEGNFFNSIIDNGNFYRKIEFSMDKFFNEMKLLENIHSTSTTTILDDRINVICSDVPC